MLSRRNKLDMNRISHFEKLVYDMQGERLLAQLHVAPQTADGIRRTARERGISVESLIISDLERLYGVRMQEAVNA